MSQDGEEKMSQEGSLESDVKIEELKEQLIFERQELAQERLKFEQDKQHFVAWAENERNLIKLESDKIEEEKAKLKELKEECVTKEAFVAHRTINRGPISKNSFKYWKDHNGKDDDDFLEKWKKEQAKKKSKEQKKRSTSVSRPYPLAPPKITNHVDQKFFNVTLTGEHATGFTFS